MRPDSHEIYGRRRSRNLGLGLVLAAFVLLIFAVTIVKLREGADVRGFDHTFETASAGRRRTEPVARAGEPQARRSRSRPSCAVMLALSFAAVPFYTWFCRVTGYGGTTASPAPPSEAVARPHGHGALRRQHRARHALGVPAEAADDAAAARRDRPRLLRGPQPDRPAVAGQAGYNVVPYRGRAATSTRSPASASSMQVLGPGERIDMPVSFFVDPAMLEDVEARDRDRHHALLHHVSAPTLPEAGLRAGDRDRLAAAPTDRAGRSNNRGTRAMAGHKNHDYHILPPSIWPLTGALGALVMLFGAVLWFHDGGPWLALIGLVRRALHHVVAGGRT